MCALLTPLSAETSSAIEQSTNRVTDQNQRCSSWVLEIHLINQSALKTGEFVFDGKDSVCFDFKNFHSILFSLPPLWGAIFKTKHTLNH